MSFLNYQKDNPEFLNDYLKYFRFISFGTESTVDENYCDLRTFFRFIKLSKNNKEKIETVTREEFKEIEIKDITLEDIRTITYDDLIVFLSFLGETLKNTPKTRNRKLASIKKFFDYLATNNYISVNPSIGLQSASIGKRIPQHLNLEECKELLSNTINSESRYRIRNYAITCLFLNCNLRLEELVNIDLDDIKNDESEQTIRICGKGNKERLLYLNAAACEAIDEYLKIRPKLSINNKDYNALFISSQLKRISKRMVQTIIKEEMLQTLSENKKDECHAHVLRHTSTTLLYEENDIDIFILKLILGHKSLEATEIYTHISEEKLKELMNTCAISCILERERSKEDE